MPTFDDVDLLRLHLKLGRSGGSHLTEADEDLPYFMC